MRELPYTQRKVLCAARPAVFKVLITMWLLGGVNVGNVEIKHNSGLSLPTIRDSLKELSEWGIVIQTHKENGWQLIGHGFDFMGILSEKVFHSPTTTTINNNIDITNELVVVAEKVSLLDGKQDVYDLLASVGIGEPSRSKLASMEHVTLEYLEGHIQSWRSEAGRRRGVGLLIHKVKNADPVPEMGTPSEKSYDSGEYADFIET